jgi:hypothetical protein
VKNGKERRIKIKAETKSKSGIEGKDREREN